MTITVTNSASEQKLPDSVTDRKTIAEDFDVFLKLLTTQLKNQNPLEPLKTAEFTQQMVAFTQVEQQIKANKNLENLGDLFAQSTLSSTVSYIGKTVTADGDTTSLENGQAKWDVNLSQQPAESKVVIQNEFGKVVYSADANFRDGMNSYVWDGQTNSGSAAPSGLYTIKIHATNSDGEILDVNTLISGTVTGIDMTGKDTMLKLGDRSVKLDNVKKINA